MLISRYLKWAVAVCILAMVALAAAACGGTGAAPADPVNEAQLSGVLPPLSEIAELARTASENVELTRLGSEAFTQSGGATEDGDDLVLVTTATQPLEWGMYLYQLTDKIPMRFTTSLTLNGGTYWLAVGNFTDGTWEMVGPFDDEVHEFPTLPAANYKSDGNIAVIAVLAGRMGDTDSDLSIQRVVLTAGGGTSPEL